MIVLTVVLAARLLNPWNYEVERRVQKLWKQAYCEQDSDDDEASLAGLRPSRITRIAVAFLRSELGGLTDTTANRIVVSDKLRKFMLDRNMRRSDISRVFPQVVEMYFIKSPEDISAMEMRRSAFARKYGRRGANL